MAYEALLLLRPGALTPQPPAQEAGAARETIAEQGRGRDTRGGEAQRFVCWQGVTVTCRMCRMSGGRGSGMHGRQANVLAGSEAAQRGQQSQALVIYCTCP